MAKRRFREVENPERRIEETEKEKGLYGQAPTNNNENNVILTEDEFDKLLAEDDDIDFEALSSEEIEFDKKMKMFRQENEQPENIQQEEMEEEETEIESTINDNLHQTTVAQVQGGNNVHIAGIKKISEIKKDEPTVEFDISGDSIEETLQDSRKVRDTEIQEQTKTVSRGGISGTVASREETRSNIKKATQVEHGREGTVQNAQEVDRDTSLEEKSDTKYIADGKTLQERLEALQKQQRQDFERFQMSVNIDSGNEYEKGFRKSLAETMKHRKVEIDKLKKEISKDNTIETYESSTQLTVPDDNKHPILRLILAIFEKLNGKAEEANKEFDEISEKIPSDSNNPIIKWMDRMQKRIEKVLFPDSNKQNTIKTADRSQVRGAKSIFDIMDQQIEADQQYLNGEDTPHLAFVREVSGNGKYHTYGKAAQSIKIPVRNEQVHQIEEEEQEHESY